MAFLQNILGLLISVSICFPLSWNKNRVPWMTVVKALVAEFVIAFIIVKIPLGAKALKALSDGITALLNWLTGMGLASDGSSHTLGKQGQKLELVGEVYVNGVLLTGGSV